jgi:hypothetical protein
MKVFLDYDSSINNLIHKWVDWMNHEFSLDFKVRDVSSYNWVLDIGKKHGFDSFAFFDGDLPYLFEEASCSPLPGSISLVDSLRESFRKDDGEDKLSILTATHDDILIPQKNIHISEHFGKDTSVIHEKNKSIYAVSANKSIRNVIIDDNPDICMEWALTGGYAILYTGEGEYTYSLHPEYNHPNLVVVDTYAQIIEKASMFKALSEISFVMRNEDSNIGFSLSAFSNQTEIGKAFFTIDGGVATIKSIDVSSKYMDQGIEAKIFSLLIDKYEVLEIFLSGSDNEEILFYERMGFEFEDDTKMTCSLSELHLKFNQYSGKMIDPSIQSLLSKGAKEEEVLPSLLPPK